MTIARRSFITGLISLVAAPAIVRAGSLMPVKSIVEPHLSGRAIMLMMQGDRYGSTAGLLGAQKLINFRRMVALEYLSANPLLPYRS